MGRIGIRITLAAVVAALFFAAHYNAAAEPKRSDTHVKVTAKADKPDADGKQVVSITLDIEKGWHTYANPSGDETGPPTKVTFEGIKAEDVRITYPAGQPYKAGDTILSIYEGSVTIKATVPRDGSKPLKAKVKFQTCNENTCLPTATVEVMVP